MTEQRLRLDLGYDGTAFHGWAAQAGLRTVEGELATWLTRITESSDPVNITVAGRTDAGVHARGQVAHIDLSDEIDPLWLQNKLARVLPSDIYVHKVSVAPSGFDARFAANWRRYVYRLWDQLSTPDPLLRNHVVWVKKALDPDLMTTAGSHLLGLKDFAPFCKYREGATTIRNLFQCEAHRLSDKQGTIELTVRADAFCHSMVRSLTGALVSVGTRSKTLQWLDEVSSSPIRHTAVAVMPAFGLCLEEVAYPREEELAERVRTAKSRRTVAELQPNTSDCGCSIEG